MKIFLSIIFFTVTSLAQTQSADWNGLKLAEFGLVCGAAEGKGGALQFVMSELNRPKIPISTGLYSSIRGYTLSGTYIAAPYKVLSQPVFQDAFGVIYSACISVQGTLKN